jgi:RNA polymerase sigma-70 factor (ECF subfamily)
MAESNAEASEAGDVERWTEEARARWPLIQLGAVAFQDHLARLGRGTPAFPVDAYLAAACAAGDAAAVRALEEEFIARVPDVARRVDAAPVFASDLSQQVRIRLLVREGDASPPRIARYTGEVPLSAWIRVIALRLAFNAKRGAKAASGQAPEEERPAEGAAPDPEVEYLRAQYRESFARSFKDALGGLSKDDRTILKLHYVDGVNIDGIGRIFQVHRATVARWLVRIRADVLARAKARLAEHVGAEPDEAESVVAALVGEVDFTLSRALGAVSVDGPAGAR